jgi:hypothetical protein
VDDWPRYLYEIRCDALRINVQGYTSTREEAILLCDRKVEEFVPALRVTSPDVTWFAAVHATHLSLDVDDREQVYRRSHLGDAVHRSD